MSDRETLVLFHGLTMSARAWHTTRAVPDADFDVVTPTALGHAGGRSPRHRPIKIADVVDDAERTLDELADRPGPPRRQLDGRLGRARAGPPRPRHAPSPRSRPPGRGTRPRASTSAPATRSPAPAPTRAAAARCSRSSCTSRRSAASRCAAPPPTAPAWRPREIIAAADDLLGCTVLDDLLTTTESLPPLDPTPTTPITVAWSGADALLLARRQRRAGPAADPNADHITLPGVGHVPMLDDPALVAATIRATAARHADPVRTLGVH